MNENELKKYIGEKIKDYRKSFDLTTVELGNLSNTSQSTISTIERGERFGNFDSMINISMALGVTLYDILPPEISENLNVPSPYSERINIILDRLSSEDIEVTENLVVNYMPLLRMISDLTPTQKKHLTNFLNSIMNNE